MLNPCKGTTNIRHCTIDDVYAIYKLYKSVTYSNPGKLTQHPDEVTLDYVAEVLQNSMQRGIAFVIEKTSGVIGFCKAFTSRFSCLAHVLNDITAMISPEYQGSAGYGAYFIKYLLSHIEENMAHIMRVEIVPHSSNRMAIGMYQKLGFAIDGICKNKILNPDKTFEDEIILSWTNKHFSKDALISYHSYLLDLIHQNQSVQRYDHLSIEGKVSALGHSVNK